MASCVVCSTRAAAVYCASDEALLCSVCDSSIHSANDLARRHHRVPICELCKRNGTTIYCHDCSAALCTSCQLEVHSASSLPHNVVRIEDALAQRLVTLPDLPDANLNGAGLPASSASVLPMAPAGAVPFAAYSAPHQQQQLNAALMTSTPSPAQDSQAPVADEVSACGMPNSSSMHFLGAGGAGGSAGYRKGSEEAGASVHHSPSEGNTSAAVVPDFGAQAGGSMAPAFPTNGLPSQDEMNAKAPWAREFDALDFESAWFGNLDNSFDLFSDLLDAPALEDAPGMVPTLAPHAGNSSHHDGAGASMHVPQLLPSSAGGASAKAQPHGGLDLGDSLLPRDSHGLLDQSMPPPGVGVVPGTSEQLPPSMLLDDDFVVPSFLPDDDELAALDPSRAAQRMQPQHQHHFHTQDLMQPQQALGAYPQGQQYPQMQQPYPLPQQQYPQGQEHDEDEEEHAAARAVVVPDASQQTPTKYGTRKRGASTSVDEMHRGSGRQSSGGNYKADTPSRPSRSYREVPPPPPLSGPALLALNGANLTREQRVARYREKRKNRKFHKTIRYASRKAYAEVRPRIKGRFATKEEVAAWKAKKEAGVAIAPEDELIF